MVWVCELPVEDCPCVCHQLQRCEKKLGEALAEAEKWKTELRKLEEFVAPILLTHPIFGLPEGWSIQE